MQVLWFSITQYEVSSEHHPGSFQNYPGWLNCRSLLRKTLASEKSKGVSLLTLIRSRFYLAGLWRLQLLWQRYKISEHIGQCLWISVRHLILCLMKACYKYQLILPKTGTLLHWLKAAGKWQWIELGRSVYDNSSQTFFLYPGGKHSLCLHIISKTAKGHFPPTKARGA